MASVYGGDNDETSNSGASNLYYGGGGNDLMAGSTASDEIYGGEEPTRCWCDLQSATSGRGNAGQSESSGARDQFR